MAKQQPDERKALRAFRQRPPLAQQSQPVITIIDYLRILSKIPPSLCPEKPAKFTDQHWKL